jgi:hypothetical protein
VGDLDAKLRQQEALAALSAAHPWLVVSTGVVEPEPDAPRLASSTSAGGPRATACR